jgi:hypothetical protein
VAVTAPIADDVALRLQREATTITNGFDPEETEAGAVVDGLPALSMLPVLALAPRYRRAAAVSACAATAWVALTTVAVGGAPGGTP